MTIGEDIRERAEGEPNTTPDWYANELYAELSQVAETRFPKIGELCFFTYTASFPEKYPFYDRRPLVYVMDFQGDKMLGGNLHYLNPSYRGDPEEYLSIAQLVTENFSNKYGQKVSPENAWDSI